MDFSPRTPSSNESNKPPRHKQTGYLFFCRAGPVDEGDLRTNDGKDSQTQPFQPYNFRFSWVFIVEREVEEYFE